MSPMFMYHVTNVDIYYYCIHSNHDSDTKYSHYGTVGFVLTALNDILEEYNG